MIILEADIIRPCALMTSACCRPPDSPRTRAPAPGTLGHPRKMCGPAVNTQHVGSEEQFPLGFVTTTGYGDGGYKVYVEKNAEGRIKSVTVVFIRDVEEAENDG